MISQCRAIAWDRPDANCCVRREGHGGQHANTFGARSARWAETGPERDAMFDYQLKHRRLREAAFDRGDYRPALVAPSVNVKPLLLVWTEIDEVVPT